ncbi:AP-4 complex accessory subunit RUSC1 isoform X4 [Paroedura picta]|uniref:AP-4 complex accessory subunit RUSC1 isoform X4 n=1 Tax=Paroedura picta TaxID=143630 RepID=UPI004056BAD0
MQSPKKGLICNLNHVHLQHVSLGLHLSRHPELREDSNPSALKRQTDCPDCHGRGGLEVVDANSNNPLTPCRCCDSHPLRSDLNLGLQVQPASPDSPAAKDQGEEDDEEEAGSPSEGASSSVSSCSDLSLDETPVSVYYKEFPAEEAPSPDQQPNIVPLEDSHGAGPPAGGEERGPNLNIRLGSCPASRVQDSPDSLGSSSSLGSPSASPCTESPAESPPTVASAVPSIAAPPIRPCRAPPAVPAPHLGPKLDSNCNALPAQPPKSENLPAQPSGQLDVNLNRATPPRPSCPRGPPPPIPPRTKRGLQGLKRSDAGKPTAAVAPPSLPESQSGHGDPQSENGRKNVTSFHELAQKRKKATAVPPFPQARKDQSDWLILFSPDTELPPCNELTCGSAPSQEATGPPASVDEPADRADGGQREVTTFKELRYRKQKAQPTAKGGAPPALLVDLAKGVPDGIGPQDVDRQLPPAGPFRVPKETQARRKKSHLGLQPIAERGCEEAEAEGMEQEGPRRGFENVARWTDPRMTGKAEKRDRHLAEVRHSQSFGGVPSAGRPWGADIDRVSVQLKEQKKALLVAVSASVDRIVAHFSTARNVVQKAQLGDSRLNPEVGYLVVGTLCPALRALVCDGLKPFQKDVITGQRPSSPWSVVEASAKPGPHTRSLNALYWRVSRLAPLRTNQQRFHAFILGLLNMKQLEQWFFNLQQNTDLISALYLPSAFLVLTQGFCRRWAEEVLLLLQPLSTLTFQLDLLFEYHHLSLDVRPVSHQTGTPTELSVASRRVCGPGRPHLARHLGPISNLMEGPLAQSSPLREPQTGVSLPQRLLQWGDLLTHTLRGSEAPPKLEPCPPSDSPGTEEKQCSWWGRLSPASGVHGDAASSNQEGLPFTRWTKLRMALEEAVKEVCTGTGVAATGSAVPSPRQHSGEMPAETPTSEAESSPGVAAEQKPERSQSGAAESGSQEADEDAPETPGKGQRLGWLFGATSPAVSGSPSESESSVAKSSRRPSSWLSPSMNVLALVKKAAPTEKSWAEETWEEGQPDPLQPYRAVRALCNHTGTGADQLSFRKGDILQVLDTVNEDWLQCCRGDSRGLVPVSYTSLIL